MSRKKKTAAVAARSQPKQGLRFLHRRDLVCNRCCNSTVPSHTCGLALGWPCLAQEL